MGGPPKSMRPPTLARWSLVLIVLGSASVANQDALLFGLAAIFAVLGSMGAGRAAPPPAPALALGLFLYMYLVSDGAHLTTVPITITTGLLACLAAASLAKSGLSYVAIVCALVTGVSIHAALNLWLLLREHGLRPDTRQFDDFWTMSPLAATAHAAFWIPLVGLLPLLFVWRRRGRGWLVSLAVIGTVFLASSLLASRTLILLLTLVLFGWLLVGRYFISDSPRLSGTTSAVMGTVGVLGAAVIWVSPGILRGLPLFARLATPEASLGDDPRIDRWVEYATRGWAHFYGGGHLRAEIGFGHNLWLDVLDAAGVPAFICLTAFSGLYLYHALSLARSKRFTIGERVAALSLAVTCTVQAATEPLLEGMPIVFVVMCALSGATAAARQSRIRQHEGPAISQSPRQAVR